jgi:hypothetical protein
MAKKSSTTTKTETKPTETRQQKFVRLANARVSKAVKAIYNIGNLGGTGYESTQEQRDKVVAALTDACESVRVRLNKEQVKPSGFTL